jgi:hypothetical protein
MRERVPAGPGEGLVIAGSRYVGLLGSEILTATATGDHGAGIFVPWLPEASNRYRAIVTSTSGGLQRLEEDGAGLADSPFSSTLTVYEYAAGSTNAPNVWPGVAINGSIGVTQPPAVEVDAGALAILQAAIGVQISAASRGSATVTVEVPAVLQADIGASVTMGVVLPPLIEGLRRVCAGRKTPAHLRPIDVGEIDNLVVDFGCLMPDGDAVQTVDLHCEARVGIDASPSPLLYGLPQVQGEKVLQRVRGDLGTVGVTYLLRATAHLASGRALVAAAFLKVVRLA